MTEDDYHKALKSFGLIPTGLTSNIAELWETRGGEPYWVTKPSELTPEQRRESIEWHRRSLGIDFPATIGVH